MRGWTMRAIFSYEESAVNCIYGITDKVIKHASHLNRHNFRAVKDIGFLFSTLHNTPFLRVQMYFDLLYKHSADVARFDTQWGSRPP